MITLKETFLSEAPNTLDSLEKQIDKISNIDEAESFTDGYAEFLELIDSLVGTELSGPHSSAEKAFRNNPDVDPFFKFLLSRTKRDLYSGALDWDHLPGERAIVKKVYRALKAHTKPSAKPSSPLSPEEAELKHASKMHSGEYGKLDQ